MKQLSAFPSPTGSCVSCTESKRSMYGPRSRMAGSSSCRCCCFIGRGRMSESARVYPLAVGWIDMQTLLRQSGVTPVYAFTCKRAGPQEGRIMCMEREKRDLDGVAGLGGGGGDGDELAGGRHHVRVRHHGDVNVVGALHLL